MKKLVQGLLCTTLISTMLVGCGTSTSSSSTSAQEESPVVAESPKVEPVTVTYACWDSNQAKLLRKVADEFESKNPDIKIDIQVNGWADYWVMLEAAATGGSLPDTFWMHSNNIYYYGANDQLLDLTSYIDQSSLVDLSNYPEGLNQIYNIEDKQYAIPKDYDTIGLWYNKTLFDGAGLAYPDNTWTWDDLYNAAKVLTKDDGSQYGMCAGLHNQEGYYNFVYQNGGEIITSDKKSGYDEEKTIEGIEFYFNFVKEGLSPAIYNDQERAQAIENGLCAMGLFGSWNLSGFAANDFMKENFDVAVLPMSRDGGKATIFNGLGNAIAANCKNPDQAWKWVEYLSSEEGQKLQAELGVAISAYNGTADAWTKAYSSFNVGAYIEMVDYAKIRPYSNQTSVWEDKAYELLIKAYSGEGSVKDACKEVAQMMNQAIAAE